MTENLTIHEPTSIRRYVSFCYDKIKVGKYLNNFQKYSMFVLTINLHHKNEQVPKLFSLDIVNTKNKKRKYNKGIINQELQK